MTDIIHLQEIWDELARIAETLKTTLNLKGVYQGDYAFQPQMGSIPDLVNGLWIHPTPEMTSEPSDLPHVLMQRYRFRCVYVRKISLNENPTKQMVAEVKQIANAFMAQRHMPNIVGLPEYARVLWLNVASVDFQCQEDDFTSGIAADLKAVAFQVDVMVRTKVTT